MISNAQTNRYFPRHCVILIMASVFGGMWATSCTIGPGDGTGDEPGEVLYTTARTTSGGEVLSCAECHGSDGSGGDGPDIRGSSSSHLQSHSQGGGSHPEGVKYPNLIQEDFDLIAEFLGGEHSGDEDDDIDDLVGDPVHGQVLLTTPSRTVDGVHLSCASCHREDGAGAAGPSILGQAATHLREHAQGTAPHPDSVKFPELTDQDFADIAAFLASDGHDHDHD